MNKKIVLFDMDGTLTPPREEFDINLLPALRQLSRVAEIGIVTGSDYDYVTQQMRLLMENSEIRYNLHILPCNGTKYYPPPQSFDHKEHSLFREDEIKSFKKFLKREELCNNVEVKLGGDTSYDIFPTGWDKTFSLQHFEGYECWFVGDRCGVNGNDREIYEKLRYNNRSFDVENPENTRILLYNEIIPRISNDR